MNTPSAPMNSLRIIQPPTTKPSTAGHSLAVTIESQFGPTSPRSLLEFVQKTIRQHGYDPQGKATLSEPTPRGICSVTYELKFHDRLQTPQATSTAQATSPTCHLAINRAIDAMQRAHAHLSGDAAVIEELGQAMVNLDFLRRELVRYDTAMMDEERVPTGDDYSDIMVFLCLHAMKNATLDAQDAASPPPSPGM